MTDFYIPPQAFTQVSSDDIGALPQHAYALLNRCNLPAAILGSHRYQHYPLPLTIDCVAELHKELFIALQAIADSKVRAVHFHQYMCSAFLLGKSEQAGFSHNAQGVRRDKSDYLRLLRGWLFSADGIEAAVMKRWVESRFGLRTLNHGGLLEQAGGPVEQQYHADYVRGLYNSNALEAQLDLLYSYCQYELQRRWPERTHWQLYRGVNRLNKHYRLAQLEAGQQLLLLNNLNSFSCDRYSCESFGDVILQTQVPVTKLIYFPELLSAVLQGEREYLALGGVYQAAIVV